MKEIRVITVTDLHQNRQLYQDLQEAVAQHKPDLLALVGDFLDHGEPSPRKLSEKECAEILSQLPCEVIFTRGNHEQENWYAFADAWSVSGRELHALHGAFVFGPLVIIGFPSLIGNGEPFLNERSRVTEETFEEWMSDLLETYGKAIRTLWLMHEPPSGTRLTVNDGGPLSGHLLWREAIQRYAPKLVISGHDHQTPIKKGIWNDKIGDTLCVNLGQVSDRSPHYLIVDWQFPDDTVMIQEAFNFHVTQKPPIKKRKASKICLKITTKDYNPPITLILNLNSKKITIFIKSLLFWPITG